MSELRGEANFEALATDDVSDALIDSIPWAAERGYADRTSGEIQLSVNLPNFDSLTHPASRLAVVNALTKDISEIANEYFVRMERHRLADKAARAKTSTATDSPLAFGRVRFFDSVDGLIRTARESFIELLSYWDGGESTLHIFLDPIKRFGKRHFKEPYSAYFELLFDDLDSIVVDIQKVTEQRIQGGSLEFNSPRRRIRDLAAEEATSALLSEARADITQAVDEVRAIAATANLSADFETVAEREWRQANVFRWLAVTSIVIAFGISSWIAVREVKASWDVQALKFVVDVPLLLLHITFPRNPKIIVPIVVMPEGGRFG